MRELRGNQRLFVRSFRPLLLGSQQDWLPYRSAVLIFVLQLEELPVDAAQGEQLLMATDFA